MESNQESQSPVAAMRLWKWSLELLLGIVVFFTAYGFCQGIGFVLEYTWLKCISYVVASALIVCLLLAWSRLFEKKWPLQLVDRQVFLYLSQGWIVGVLFFCSITLIFAVCGCYSGSFGYPQWGNICLSFISFLLVACGEEVIFRGLLYRMISERFGMWLALTVSSLFFGIVHIFNPGASLWSSIAIAIEAGLLLGAAYQYSGSLWLPIGIHWAWNFTQGNVFGFAVSGGDSGDSFFVSSATGPELFTGGAFGPEASILAAVLGALISAFYIRMYLKKQKG